VGFSIRTCLCFSGHLTLFKILYPTCFCISSQAVRDKAPKGQRPLKAKKSKEPKSKRSIEISQAPISITAICSSSDMSASLHAGMSELSSPGQYRESHDEEEEEDEEGGGGGGMLSMISHEANKENVSEEEAINHEDILSQFMPVSVEKSSTKEKRRSKGGKSSSKNKEALKTMKTPGYMIHIYILFMLITGCFCPFISPLLSFCYLTTRSPLHASFTQCVEIDQSQKRLILGSILLEVAWMSCSRGHRDWVNSLRISA